MTETPISVEEKPPAQTIEIRYPGFNATLREVTLDDAPKINEINNSAVVQQGYDDASEQTQEQTKNWLLGGVTRRLKSLNPGSTRDAAVGTEKGQSSPSDEMMIVTQSVKEVAGIEAYTLVYKSNSVLSPELQQKHTGANIELSYVSDVKDEELDSEQMGGSLAQVAMMMVERTLGKNPKEFNGELTAEKIGEAEKNMAIFASSGVGVNETNYRLGLKGAGFEPVHQYKDEKDGIDYITYQLNVKHLAQLFEQSREAAKTTASQTSV